MKVSALSPEIQAQIAAEAAIRKLDDFSARQRVLVYLCATFCDGMTPAATLTQHVARVTESAGACALCGHYERFHRPACTAPPGCKCARFQAEAG